MVLNLVELKTLTCRCINMAKKKISHEDELRGDALHYVMTVDPRIKADPEGFWQSRITEILPIYKDMLAKNPEHIDEILEGFAWHAFTYALKQR